MLMLAPAAQAVGVSICVSDRPAAPLSFPDREGQAQYLARMSARAAGAEAAFVVMPWRRCVESVRAGLLNGLIGIQAYQTFKDVVRFPVRNGQADRTYSVGASRWVFLTQADSPVTWDGKVLNGLNTPIAYPSGVNVVRETLEGMGIRSIDSAKTAPQLAQQLKAARYQVAVVHESDAKGFLAQDTPAALRILSPVFLQSDAYLAFNNDYAQANPVLVAAMWEEIRRIRASREWLELAPALAK
jgi:polar amino acid transport system substrate-binding protein